MASFVFWNVQRLGKGTPEHKRMILEAVLSQIYREDQVEFALLCEVTGSGSLGDAAFSREIHVRKSGQLGYSTLMQPDGAMELEKFPVGTFTEVFGHAAHKKGGSDFRRQSKRFVGFAGSRDGVPIYFYHANASGRAAFVVAWVAEALRQEHNGKFLLVGDLNCEPSEFATEINICSRNRDFSRLFQTIDDGPTHNAKTSLINTYDWVVAGNAVKQVVKVRKADFSPVIKEAGLLPVMSDHLPIVVEY